MERHLLSGLFSQPASILFPIAILSLKSNEDKAFVEKLYFEYRELMYMAAQRYLGSQLLDIEDAISSAVVNMCIYVEKLRAVDQANLRSYVLATINNACLRQLKAKNRQNAFVDYSATPDLIENIPSPADTYTSVFDEADAKSLLDSFQFLSDREKDLIRMRHIDKMEFEEIAKLLSMSTGAVRTALTRAKQRIRKMAKTKE